MKRKKSIIGVIPSRYASQRLPAKPLVDLLGKTMVQRVYEQACKAKLLTRVVVATDDERIKKVVQSFGGNVVMTSPDIQSGSDRVAAVAEKISGDLYVNVQGDEPLIAPEMIDTAVQAMLDDEKAPMGTVARIITDAHDLNNPALVKVVIDKSSNALYFSRSVVPFVRDEKDMQQWLAHSKFLKHIGLYVYRKDFLKKFRLLKESSLEKAEKLEQLRVLENGYRIKVALTPHDSVPIDTQDDVKKVVAILQQTNSSSL